MWKITTFHRFGASVHAKVISIFFHLFRKRQQVCENLEETPDVSRHEVKIRLLRSPPPRCSSTPAPPPWPSPWSWRPTSCGQGLHEHDMTSTWCRFRDIMLNTRWVFDEFAMIIISLTTSFKRTYLIKNCVRWGGPSIKNHLNFFLLTSEALDLNHLRNACFHDICASKMTNWCLF